MIVATSPPGKINGTAIVVASSQNNTTAWTPILELDTAGILKLAAFEITSNTGVDAVRITIDGEERMWQLATGVTQWVVWDSALANDEFIDLNNVETVIDLVFNTIAIDLWSTAGVTILYKYIYSQLN